MMLCRGGRGHVEEGPLREASYSYSYSYMKATTMEPRDGTNNLIFLSQGIFLTAGQPHRVVTAFVYPWPLN